MDEKVLIALISVAVGWLLAQGTAFVKDWWTARKLKAGLLTELEDIQDQLQRVVLIHQRQLQIFGLKGMEPSYALPVQSMFFKQYFKDVFSRLNREQRISYQLIYGLLDALNKRNEDLAKFFRESHKELRNSPDDKKKIAPTIELWGEQVVCLYKTAMEIRWHIAYHLSNPQSPAFDLLGPNHESYLKFEEELDQEVKKIIDGAAKQIKREDFEKIYDAKGFNKDRNAG